jgi:hypothetical protein
MTTLGIVARGLVAACASLTTPCWRALCGQIRTLVVPRLESAIE